MITFVSVFSLASVVASVVDSCTNVTLLDGMGLVCCRNGTFSWNRVEDTIQFTDVVLDECRQLVMDHHVESDVTVTVLSVVGAMISVFGVLLLVTRLICIIRTRFHHQRLDDISLHSIEEDRL